MWEKRFEVFYAGTVRDGGWYVWFRDGRIPNGNPDGPFKTAQAAVTSVEFRGYPIVVTDGE